MRDVYCLKLDNPPYQGGRIQGSKSVGFLSVSLQAWCFSRAQFFFVWQVFGGDPFNPTYNKVLASKAQRIPGEDTILASKAQGFYEKF